MKKFERYMWKEFKSPSRGHMRTWYFKKKEVKLRQADLIWAALELVNGYNIAQKDRNCSNSQWPNQDANKNSVLQWMTNSRNIRYIGWSIRTVSLKQCCLRFERKIHIRLFKEREQDQEAILYGDKYRATQLISLQGWRSKMLWNLRIFEK